MDMLNELTSRQVCLQDDVVTALLNHGCELMRTVCIIMLTEFLQGNKIGNDCMTITLDSFPFL